MVTNQSQTWLVKIWIWQVHFRIVLLSTVEENQTSQPIFNTHIIVSYMLLHNNRKICTVFQKCITRKVSSKRIVLHTCFSQKQ